MQAVRERIGAQADDGVAALVISTDLDELLQLCDRIAVLYRGRVSGVVDNGPGADERIGELMVGGKAA
jgi:simple sugar transport system ATP-binding protein